jgi:hypothetical protein
MDELVLCGGSILITIGAVTWIILRDIANAKKAIITKQDAIMAKLIEIKLR